MGVTPLCSVDGIFFSQTVTERYGLPVAPDQCYLAEGYRVVVPQRYITELQRVAKWKNPMKTVKQMMDDLLGEEQYGIPGGSSALRANSETRPIIEAIEGIVFMSYYEKTGLSDYA